MSGSVLKILACVIMLLDHTAAYIPEEIPGINDILFCIGSKEITLRYLMRVIGRTGFPIFAFLITEGFVHTRNRRRYAVNLFIFALISEIPFNLVGGGEFFYRRQNVFFTLLLGYLGVWCSERFKESGERKNLLLIVALFLFSILLRADYGCFGYGFIILLYLLRSNRVLMCVVGTCVLPSRWIGGMGFIPIYMYNGTRGFAKGPVAKYAFYLFYPLHLLLLYLIGR